MTELKIYAKIVDPQGGKMEIYFAGSIRGGRDDQFIYSVIISELRKYGIILTEHIGKESLTNAGEEKINDNQIYSRDIKWIEKCDVVVAEVTNPSHGVGFEIGYAQSLRKHVLCLYREIEDRKVSAMISGNPFLYTRHYYNISSLVEILREFFEKITKE